MKKIMIIDDELEIIDILDRYLSRSGKYDVECYSNPSIALDKAKAGNYDLILSDIMMPQTDGISILRELKQTRPYLKVALMTAYSNRSKVEQSNSLNVDLYLEKPFSNLQDIERQLSNLIGA